MLYVCRTPARLVCCLGLFCLGAGSLAGCGESGEGEWIRGTVTYRDQPLSNASITFFPAKGRPLIASISDGEYSLQVPPGDYKVTVGLGVELPEGWEEGDPVPPREISLPSRYSNIKQTQLTATVVEDHREPIDFALE